MNTLLSDLRYAWRGMRRSPGFAALIVLTLGLGIGANTAIFSVINGVLLRPLPYRDSDQLVEIRSRGMGGKARFGISYPDYQDLQTLTGSLAGIALYRSEQFNLTGGTEPREVSATMVSPGLFALLGAAPAAGRVFAAGEDEGAVAILSHRLWQELFNADPSAVGRQVSLDGKDFTVVGVMPADFAYPDEDAALWLPIGTAFAQDPDLRVNRDDHFLSAVARLAPGIGLDRLHSDLDLLARRIAASQKDNGQRRVQITVNGGGGPSVLPGPSRQGFTNDGFSATPMRENVVGDVKSNLLILLGAVAVVLLIGCANAANLLMARAGARRREMGIRAALGAGRGRLVRQVLTESVLLALAASVTGLLLAAWGVHLLLATWPRTLPRAGEIHLDQNVLAFTLGLGIVTGLLFGLLPALRLARPEATESLRDDLAAGAGRQRRRTQSALVVAEVALALMLLVGAGLLVRSFVALNSVQLGFQPENVLAARLRLTPSRYPNPTAQREFFSRLTGRLADRPGISSISIARTLPLSGARMIMAINPRDVNADDPDQFLPVGMSIVGPDFFSALKIPMLQGRPFTDQDREGAPRVVIINQQLARRLWPGRNPLGLQLPAEGPGGGGRATVVGVIGDVRAGMLADAPTPEIFLPAAQSSRMDEMWVLFRAEHPLRQVPVLREVVRQDDPSQPIGDVVTLDQMVARQEAARRFNTTLITLFAALALVLAVIGIAGLTAYAVAQRRREIGIRISLGAQGGDVLRLLLSESGRLVATGVVIGLAGAVLIAPVLASMLYGISSRDMASFTLAGILLVVVALVATWVPARRALRVDPMTVLREE